MKLLVILFVAAVIWLVVTLLVLTILRMFRISQWIGSIAVLFITAAASSVATYLYLVP